MFISGGFDADRFLELIDGYVVNLLKAINTRDTDREERRLFAAELHRACLESIPDQKFWKKSFTPKWIDQFNQKFGHISGASLTVRVSVCYACLFGRPEYSLPCGHVICFSCLREFDQSPLELKYPGIALHKECVLCGSSDEEGWPYKMEYRPDLSGIRVLSLDGGGVRGIIQLSILRRLENLLDLDMPFGEFFDFIIGTSTGE